MLSKRYEFTEVDHRTWLHVPFGTYGPQALTLTKYLKYEKKTSSKIDSPF